MTQLLISVRNAEEARAAIQGGANLIDIKEPRRGPLGPADMDVWNAVLRRVAGSCPLSVALGELRYDAAASRARNATGFDFAKVGLAGCRGIRRWHTHWQSTLAQLPPTVAAVAVVYADAHRARAPDPNTTLRWAIDLGCRAVLVDTYSKTREGAKAGPDVFDFLPPTRLAPIIDQARAAKMRVVLGGSLTLASLPRALELEPDYIAVRGAACREDRLGELDTSRVRQLADCIRSGTSILHERFPEHPQTA
jgi:uncharacterized protein (UPF0264 family)